MGCRFLAIATLGLGLGLALRAGAAPKPESQKEKAYAKIVEQAQTYGRRPPPQSRASRPSPELKLNLPADFWSLSAAKAAEALLAANSYFGTAPRRQRHPADPPIVLPPDAGSAILARLFLADPPDKLPVYFFRTAYLTWSSTQAQWFSTARCGAEPSWQPEGPEGVFQLNRARLLHLLEVIQCLRGTLDEAAPRVLGPLEPARVIVNRGPRMLEFYAAGTDGWQSELHGEIRDYPYKSWPREFGGHAVSTLVSLLWDRCLPECARAEDLRQAGDELGRFELAMFESENAEGYTEVREKTVRWLFARFQPAWERAPDRPTLLFAWHTAALLAASPMADEGSASAALADFARRAEREPALAADAAGLSKSLDQARRRQELAKSPRELLRLALEGYRTPDSRWACNYVESLGVVRCNPGARAAVLGVPGQREPDSFARSYVEDPAAARKTVSDASAEGHPGAAQLAARFALLQAEFEEPGTVDLSAWVRDRSQPAAVRVRMIELHGPGPYTLRRPSAALDRALVDMLGDESDPPVLLATLRALAARTPEGAFAALEQRWQRGGLTDEAARVSARLALASCAKQANPEGREWLRKILREALAANPDAVSVTAAILADAWDLEKTLPARHGPEAEFFRAAALAEPRRRLLLVYAVGANRQTWAWTEGERDGRLWLLNRWVARQYRALDPAGQAEVRKFGEWLELHHFALPFALSSRPE